MVQKDKEIAQLRERLAGGSGGASTIATPTAVPAPAPATSSPSGRPKVTLPDTPLKKPLAELAPALQSEQTEYLKQAFVQLFSVDDMKSTGVQSGNARVMSAILELSDEEQEHVNGGVKVFCEALESKYLMDELGSARDAALTNVGNFALDIWGKVTRTGVNGETEANAGTESTETSSESSTASASTSEDKL